MLKPLTLRRNTALRKLISTFTLLVLCGCTTFSLVPTSSEPVEATSLPTETRTPTLAASPTATLKPSPTATPTAEMVNQVCSPLKDIELHDLHSITSQGFTPPAPYQDDGHPAVDLAFFTFEEMTSMLNHPVQSILSGRVAMVISDRFPYGNAILIETPLERISPAMLGSLSLPTPIPQQNIDIIQPCVSNPLFKDMEPIRMSDSEKSIYILYAHLIEPPTFKVGDEITCGEGIGKAGNSGNSAAEHLHLESRVGPSEAQFNLFSTYDPESTVIERWNYCIWVSSGKFQPIDPTMLWQYAP